MTLLESKYLFIGSRFCDSVLMKIDYCLLCVDVNGKEVDHQLLNQSNGTDNTLKNSNLTDSEIPNKCPRIEGEEENDKMTSLSLVESTKSSTLDDMDIVPATHYKFDEVDVELYGESILSPPSIYREIVNYSFKVVDRLINLGPMGQLTCGEVPCLAPGNTDPTDEALTCAQAEMHHVELMACIPRSFNVPTEKNPVSGGGIALLHTSVRPRGLTAFELPEYMSLWSLYGPPIITPIQNISSPPVSKPLAETNSSPSATSNKKLEIPNLESEEEKIDENVTEKPTESDENAEKTIGASESTTDDTKEESSKDDEPAVNMSDENKEEVINEDSFDIESELSNDLTHSYLLLTREDSTMILEVSHEIVELEVSGFNTTEMTVSAPLCFSLYHDQAGRLARWLWACKDLPADNSFFNLHTNASLDHLLSWPEPGSTAPSSDFTSSFTSPPEKSSHFISASEEESILLYGEPIEICKREGSVAPGYTTPQPPRFLLSSTSHSSLNSNIMETSDIMDGSGEEKLSKYFAFIVFTNGVLEVSTCYLILHFWQSWVILCIAE
ncbi:unnamed protein product [Schistosoma turkestanicum]|nr:unnamed protein product [Schistosoma turkestanicum]